MPEYQLSPLQPAAAKEIQFFLGDSSIGKGTIGKDRYAYLTFKPAGGQFKLGHPWALQNGPLMT